MKKLALFPVLLCLVASCTNPYQTARSTITISRGAVAMSQIGFDAYAKVETDRCNMNCKVDPVCLEKCLAPLKKNTAIYDKSKVTALAGLDEAAALVDVAEKLEKKQSIDWLVPLKTTACLIATSLDWLPLKYKVKVQPLLDLLRNYGCPKVTIPKA